MPANPKQQSAQPPRNNTIISSSKYTNKDGSKFITIPKVTSNSESSETSDNTMAQTTPKQTHGQVAQSPTMTDDTPVAVNRKKAKRREKERAKLAAAAGQTTQVNGTQDASTMGKLGPEAWQDYARKKHQRSFLENPQYLSGDEDAFSECYNYEESMTPPNGHSAQSPGFKTGKRKGKGKNTKSASPKAATSTTHPNSGLRMSREKIWNTSSQEERERIKVFWLSLGEEERRSLVKVEKDAVLKKMKEQQKHSCSCTVCGRKRIAIEEELEVLYDAYYEELEQYANNQSDGRPPPLMAGSRRFGALSGLAPPNRIPPRFTGHSPSRGRIVEHFGDEDDDEDDEEYSEDDVDDDDYLSGDDEPIEQITRTHANDFFNFGQNLTVKGGILTVADDLLKNDGKKFIEMMEQLAERRMAREEDAKENYGPNNYSHPSNLPPHPHHNHHNHPPPPEDEEEYDDEDEDEDGYDSEEEFDEEEMDTMTEEQRMEEGRRMFQIFAARMFEQRVLTAYKEKVAAERQEKLLQELEEEDEAATLKKAKKAKEAQKKKEKAQAKKLAQAEEKTKRDAEKAAEEAKRLDEEAKKAEEARLRAEEKRKKKEAQKRAEEEERLRKEAEKQRKLQEQRERQAEQERKKKEEKERIAREKEEQRQREKEAKETKEREARERKEKLEREKKEAEERQRADQQAREARQREDAQLRRSQQQSSVPAQGSVPSGPASQASFPPTFSAAPTPGRPAFLQRDPSSVPQTPLFGLAKTQNTSPQTSSTPSQSSPGTQTLPVRHQSQPFLHHPQATSPMHSALRSSFSQFQSGPFAGMQQQSSMNGFPQPGGFPQMGAPGFGGRLQHEPVFQNQPFGNHFRPPIFSGGLPPPQGRGFPGQHAPPPCLPPMQNGFNGFPPGFGMHKEAAPIQMHSRQQSGSMDSVAIDPIRTPSLAIARPTPIKRPGSDGNNSRGQKQEKDLEDMTNHLGSSALLDDSDEPIAPPMNPRRASAAPASLGRHAGFAPSMAYGGMDPSAFSSSPGGYNTWGPHSNPFTTGSLPGPSYMSGWGNSPSLPNGFAGLGGLGGLGGGMPMRTSQPRSVAIRLMLCRACKNLSASGLGGSGNFHPITDVRSQIGEEVVSEKELLDLCETEGNGNNGGGFFDVRKDSNGTLCIRYEADDGAPQTQRSVPGDIGSPIVGSAGLMSFGGRGRVASPPGLGAAGPPPGLSAPMGGF